MVDRLLVAFGHVLARREKTQLKPISLVIDPTEYEGIEHIDDKILYGVAREVLDTIYAPCDITFGIPEKCSIRLVAEGTMERLELTMKDGSTFKYSRSKYSRSKYSRST